MAERELLTSESVTEGHPDKLCDLVSDAILDSILTLDSHGRVACETLVSRGLVIVAGEITTKCYVDIPKVVRETTEGAGYTDPSYGFDYNSCAVITSIQEQSPDIQRGVDIGGAGDQGIMVGFAVDETPELMPSPIILAHKLVRRLSEVRKGKILRYLRPDGKSQVTMEYVDGKPRSVDTVIISAQHEPEVSEGQLREEIMDKVVNPVIPEELRGEQTKYHINPTGRFVVGGPQGDTGCTGRKIMVDTYGGFAHHGGGCFSGKDPTKVDRSASYMARYIAKNIVKAGLASRCEIQLTYAIGVARPISLNVQTFGTGTVPDQTLAKAVLKHFDLTPQGIINQLALLRPVYKRTACYGHFGREEEGFTWEKTDQVDKFRMEVGK
jgi:S-adenosylmethionine synthetase